MKKIMKIGGVAMDRAVTAEISICRTDAAEYLPDVDRADADAEFYEYVSRSDGEIAGYGCIDGAELDTVAVSIAHQGKGLGRKLVKFLVNRILDRQAGTPFLYCVIGNRARKLYDSLGFREISCSEYARKKVSSAGPVDIDGQVY